MIECGHSCENLLSVPVMYDLSYPEVLEELDLDYIEAPKKAKTKAATSAQLKQALKSLIEAIEQGNTQTIEDQTIKAKELL
jgi:hypothetical protein